MARKRQIDPDIWTSEQVISLQVEARLLFIGMISQADDEGRLKGSPLSLKVSIFPADKYDLDKIKLWRDAVVKSTLAICYEKDGIEYLSLPNFNKYQYMTKRFPSKLPSPDSSCVVVNDELIIGERQLYGIGIGIGIEVGNGIGAFDVFWKEYPKRVGKKDAEKAFRKINPNLMETILSALDKAKKSSSWQKDGGQFIPNPATWLNGKRWEDEIEESHGTHKGITANTPATEPTKEDLEARKKFDREFDAEHGIKP